MTHRIDGIFRHAALVTAFAAGFLGCATAPTAVTGPHRDWVADQCQRAIRARAAEGPGRAGELSFDTPEHYYVSRRIEGVRGGALRWTRGTRERIAYDCTVDIHSGRVETARFGVLGEDRSRGGPPSWETPHLPDRGRAASNRELVAACQLVTREMVAADHGRRAAVEFDTARATSISNRERSVEGRAVLTLGRDRDPIHYACTLDARTARVREARYRPIDRPRDLTRRSEELCHAAVRERVASDRGARSSTVFDTTEVYFVSDGAEGVRGAGRVRHPLRADDPISYDCQVNIRRGHVAEARYRYR